MTGQSGQLFANRVHWLARLGAKRSEAFATPQKAAVLEHAEGLRMQGPVRSFAGFVGMTRNLDEAIVEAEIMSQGVLPALRVDPIVREAIGDEFVNVTQRQHLFRGTPDGHGRQ